MKLNKHCALSWFDLFDCLVMVRYLTGNNLSGPLSEWIKTREPKKYVNLFISYHTFKLLQCFYHFMKWTQEVTFSWLIKYINLTSRKLLNQIKPIGLIVLMYISFKFLLLVCAAKSISHTIISTRALCHVLEIHCEKSLPLIC